MNEKDKFEVSDAINKTGLDILLLIIETTNKSKASDKAFRVLLTGMAQTIRNNIEKEKQNGK
jgi:hypothetical protein